MAMIRNLSQLKKECAQLGLEVKQSGKRESKEDYVEALRNYNLKNVEMTFGLKYRLSMKSPQLCFLSNNLRQEELDEIYNSDNWVFEEKLNGIRMIVSYDPDYGFEFYSRNISVDNYLPVPYKEKIWLGSDSNFLHMFPSFVIDTEIISVNPNICTIMGKRGVVTETILQAVAATLALNPEDSTILPSFYSRIHDIVLIPSISINSTGNIPNKPESTLYSTPFSHKYAREQAPLTLR